MKNPMHFLLASMVCLAAISTVTCEKKSEEKSERFNLLTAHTWYFDSVVTICKDPEIIEILDWFNEGFQGASATFTADGLYTLAGSDGDVWEAGSWRFTSELEEFILNYDTDDVTDTLGLVNIVVLTEEALEVIDMGDFPVSDTCYVKMIYSK